MKKKSEQQNSLFDTSVEKPQKQKYKPLPSREPGREDYPVSPYVDVTAKKSRGNPQSAKANVRAAKTKNTMRLQIYRWWKTNGPAIAEEALLAFPNKRYSTITARVSELRRDEFLRQVGTKRTIYSGEDAALLVVTDKHYPGE